MSTFAELLQTISSGRYGKDIRTAIHDALEMLRDHVTDLLQWDDTPTEGSDNGVLSGGVFSALALKQDVLTVDNIPTKDSTNLVESGGVYDAIEDASAYLAPVGLYSGSDLLAPSANYAGTAENGVTYTWSDDHSTCTADGTAEAVSFSNIYNDKTALPSGMLAGGKYYTTVSTTDENLQIQYFFYDSEEAKITDFYFIENGYFNVPENAVGAVIRLRTVTHATLANAVISNMAIYEANDATAAILAMLNSKGRCVLGNGIYPVRGLDMPANTALIGCGDASVLRFIDSGDGYAVKPSAGCRIENMQILGREDEPSNINTVGASLGGEHGIYLDATIAQPFIVNNCTILNFNGSGIYAQNLGGSIRGYMFVSDCYVRKCMVGINLAVSAEYNTFKGVRITACNHACINNGGNNVFTACEFHGVVGFYIDGSQSNSGHGTCSACLFNHIDNTNQSATLGGGDAVKIENLTYGFIFDACQFWYGFINLANSRGVKIADSQLGDGQQNPHITVTGTYPAFFSGCIFHQTPTISDAASSKFDACYLDSDGSAVTGA